MCASFRNHLAPRIAKIQAMKVIVLIVIVITMYGCGFKPKVSCKIDDIKNITESCIEQPELAISKEF